MASDPAPSGALRLFHLSDIHFGLVDERAIAWAEERIHAEKPAAVAITGDLTMRARSHEYAAACDWILGLKAPITVEVGNHDLPYFNLFERFLNPYRRFRAIEALVERKLHLGTPDSAVVVVPLKTTARAQWRLNWSKGWVTSAALEATLAAIDALPTGTRVLVACHHPLVEVGTKGSALTRGGEKALEALARRKVLAVLSGHVHDPFDLTHETASGQVRMIGAGTLSKRVRSTPPSFNELTIVGHEIKVKVRNLEAVPTPEMQIDDVPANALPPRTEGEPVAPVAAVPAEDPPVH